MEKGRWGEESEADCRGRRMAGWGDGEQGRGTFFARARYREFWVAESGFPSLFACNRLVMRELRSVGSTKFACTRPSPCLHQSGNTAWGDNLNASGG